MDRRGRTLDVIGALIFNAALFALPFAGMAAWAVYEAGDVYSYAVTAPAEAATRDALDRLGERLIPADVERTEGWRELVQREITDRDFRAAHGALLAAPAMLAPNDANRMLTQLPAEANDDQIAAAAFGYLPEDAGADYQSPIVSAHDIDLLGDLTNVKDGCMAWLAGAQIDQFMLILSGVLLAGPDDDHVLAVRARSGASVLKAARRTGRLSPSFNAYLDRRLYAAAPPDALRAQLAAAVAQAPGGQETDAVAGAFRVVIDAAAWRRLANDLAAIQSVARATEPAAAAQLLEHVDDGHDLSRLRLVAEAGRDRASFIGKRAGRSVLLGAARGTLYLTPNARGALGAVAACMIMLLGSFLYALSHAVTRQWHVVIRGTE